MIFSNFWVIIFVGDKMNNLEVIRLINGMIDNTRVVSIHTRLTYINSRLNNWQNDILMQ